MRMSLTVGEVDSMPAGLLPVQVLGGQEPTVTSLAARVGLTGWRWRGALALNVLDGNVVPKKEPLPCA